RRCGTILGRRPLERDRDFEMVLESPAAALARDCIPFVAGVDGLMVALLLLMAVVFALDRAAKALAFTKPGLGGCATIVGIVTVRPSRNRRPWPWPGGSPESWLLVFGACLAAALLFVCLDSPGAPWTRVGLGAALGGGMSNLYDRLRHGAVLD